MGLAKWLGTAALVRRQGAVKLPARASSTDRDWALAGHRWAAFCTTQKYNVISTDDLAEGGEYEVQHGFGWTNGVTLAFFALQKELSERQRHSKEPELGIMRVVQNYFYE